MIFGQDRDQLLRGGMPDVGGSNLLHVELPWRRRVTYAVVDGEAIDMRLARGHRRCLDLSRGFGRPIGVVRRKISEYCFEFYCASISFYFLPLILSRLSPPQRFYLIIPVLFQFSPTRRQKLKVRLRDRAGLGARWPTEQHRANSFFLGGTAILLQVDDIRTAKPAKAAVPRWCCGVGAPILFGHDQLLPEDIWCWLGCRALL